MLCAETNTTKEPGPLCEALIEAAGCELGIHISGEDNSLSYYHPCNRPSKVILTTVVGG